MVDRLRLKRGLARVLGRIPQSQQRDIVLLYHSVGGGPWSVPAAQFREQMEWLCGAAAAEVVSLEEITSASANSSLRVAITFDDGYANLFDVVARVAQDLRLRPTVFLNTGLIGRDRRICSRPGEGHYPGEEFLLWDEVAQLAATGWSIGSHGIAHLDLTGVDEDVARAQLRHSRATIERNLSVCCHHFAYPWGRYTRRLQKLVAQNYDFAFAGVHGAIRNRSDLFAIPRINIACDYALEDFRAIVAGDWDFLGALQRLKKPFERPQWSGVALGGLSA